MYVHLEKRERGEEHFTVSGTSHKLSRIFMLLPSPKNHDLIFPDDQDADRGRGLLHCLLAALQHILGAATLIFMHCFLAFI